ncbi:MAG: DUF547 domain-containing protein [bacterium]|nr:DUF547 domain-containing protein [bacterium]
MMYPSTIALVLAITPGAVAQASADLELDSAPYATVLRDHVTDTGLVDYAALKASPDDLDAYLRAIADLDPDTYASWPEPGRIAFWINAYNAFTLKAIVDRYPIKAGLARSLMYPKNSIRQIPGVWTRIRWTVMGEEMTLDHIEHKVLRKEFEEPRIHAALVCAALSCPPLRTEPFTGPKLNAQLDGQMRRFLDHPKKFRIGPDDNVVHLSPIFKWFGKDFVQPGEAEPGFEGYTAGQRAVLIAILPYVSDAQRAYLTAEDFAIAYLDYDWTLNEKR